MKQPVVFVNVTTPEGVLLDRFAVSHWRTELPGEADVFDDMENVGSRASNSLLAERIERQLESPKGESQ